MGLVALTSGVVVNLGMYLGNLFAPQINWAQMNADNHSNTRHRGKGGKRAHKPTGIRKAQRAAQKARNKAK